MSDLIVQGNEWSALKEQAQILFNSGFLPQAIKNANQCLTIAMMGRELELSPMAALTNISVIQGKPCMESKLMLALVFRKYPNAYYSVKLSNAKVATVELARPGMPVSEFSYTIDQAQAAGLTGKDSWKKYPEDMLMWRAVARAVRQTFPEVILNAPYTPEEMTSAIPEERIAPVTVVKPKQLAPMPELGDTDQPVDHLRETKIALEKAAVVLNGTIDLKEKTGKTIEEIIMKIRMATTQEQIEAIDRRLTELESE
jgi:hypothetical protein